MPKTSFYEKNGHHREYKFNSRPTASNTKTTTKDERNIVSEMNQMYKHSPFMQRRCGDVSETDYSATQPLTTKDAIYNNLGEFIIIKEFKKGFLS